MKLFDTHSHIDMIESLTLEEIIKNAKDAGVEKIIVPSAGKDGFKNIMNMINTYYMVYGALGVHPEEVENWDDEILDIIKDLSKHKKIIAIGEIGLDYYYGKNDKELQKDIFKKQIILANEINLPIIVHDRESHLDCLNLLKENNTKHVPVVMHCFSGSVEFMKECLKENMFIGIGGVVTFKNAQKMREVAKAVPLEKLVIETDAPYLTPVPHRGKDNQPAFVKLVAEEIAFLKGISLDELATVTTNNAERLFDI